MVPEKEASLYAIIVQLINPAISEIRDFIRYYETRKYCRSLYGFDYYGIYYYMRKLLNQEKILAFWCESGYRRRYGINFGIKRLKKRLDSCVKYARQKTDLVHVYRVGTEEIEVSFEGNDKDQQITTKKGNSFLVLYDEELSRHYLVLNNILVGVLRRTRKEAPYLPGSTYGYGTEYSRCFDLFRQKEPRHLLCLIGHRKAIGRRLT